MNEQVKQMVAGFKLPYETYKGMLSTDEFASLEAAYQELMELAEKHEDFMAFNDAAARADIFNRLSQEIAKAQKIFDSKPKEERKPPSTESFISQYRALYEQALASPHTYRTREVYEELLALGKGVETPLEVVAKAEEDNLFHKIGAMGVYDTYKLDYDKTDPNETLLRNFRADVLKVCEESLTSDELTYKVDRRVYESNRELGHDNFIIQMIANLVGKFIDMELAKAAVRAGRMEHVVSVAMCCDEAREAYRVLSQEFGLDWEKIVSIPHYKKRFLMQATILPETTRVFHAMAPLNLEWMREMLFEEILSDLSIADIILRKPEPPFHPLALDEHDVKYGIRDKLGTRARDVLKDYYWMK